MKKITGKALFLALASTLTCSVSNADATDMERKLTKLYPSTHFDSVEASHIKGIYEVILGKNIAYTDEDGKYFLFGNMVDMSTQTDLTSEKRESLDVIDWKSLPFEKAIKIKKGKGERKMAIFSDPDCPFCKRLEDELQKIDNITIYIFLNPLKQLHPSAVETSKKIWCSKKPDQAWQEYVLHGVAPTGNSQCDNPVDEIVRLSQRLGFNGTPMSILEDGTKIIGARSASEIDYALNRSLEKIKKTK